MDLDFYWDEAGDPRAAAGGALSARAACVARYLESDVQGSVGQAREIVRAIDRLLAGRLQSWSETGNAHTLTLSPRGATLEVEVEPQGTPMRLPLAELRQAVAGWQAFLERGRAAAAPAPPRP
jgi:hypothetical protein